MKKEVLIKAHKRRLKSGKVITVKAHSAKRDVDPSQKFGAGEEYIINSSGATATLDTIPYNIQTFSDEEFREWYKFNDWDTPRREWPKSVRKVDDRLKQCMTPKNFDAFCSLVDAEWTPRGYKKMLSKWSDYAKEGSPASRRKKSVIAAPVNRDIDGVTAERKAMIVKNIRESMKRKNQGSSILKEMRETYTSFDDKPKMSKSQQMKYDTLADFNRAGLNLTSKVNGVSRKMGGGVIIENSGMSIPEKTRLNFIATQMGYKVNDWSGHEYYLQKIKK